MVQAERPLRKDAERNRQRILAAARELFAERGLAATLNDVAHEAGVGVGTVYRRFPNKAELVDALFDQYMERLTEVINEALEDPDAWRGLVLFLERMLELQVADRALGELFVGAAGGFERIARARERLHPLAARLVMRAREADQLRADIEPQDLPILHMILGSVIDLTHDAEPELWRRYLAVVLQGLRAQPQPPERLPVDPLPFETTDELMVDAWRKHRR